ncbi:MAG TPA: hypothetical protein DDW36_03895 [Candidatus Magasanikbacteria bacterium]|nr:hypothetical protein [Candidatus Magasanikbacteria bacterium]
MKTISAILPPFVVLLSGCGLAIEVAGAAGAILLVAAILCIVFVGGGVVILCGGLVELIKWLHKKYKGPTPEEKNRYHLWPCRRCKKKRVHHEGFICDACYDREYYR